MGTKRQEYPQIPWSSYCYNSLIDLAILPLAALLQGFLANLIKFLWKGRLSCVSTIDGLLIGMNGIFLLIHGLHSVDVAGACIGEYKTLSSSAEGAQKHIK